MPRYFFHRTDGGFDPDFEGTELPTVEAARAEAVVFAGGTLRDKPELVWNGRDLRIEVTDTTGALLFTVITLGISAPAVRDMEAQSLHQAEGHWPC